MTVVRLPFMAHTRSAGMSVIPPLLEDKRTSRGEPISVAIDPNETLNPASVLNWQMLFVPRSTFEVAVVWIMRRTPSQAGQMRRRSRPERHALAWRRSTRRQRIRLQKSQRADATGEFQDPWRILTISTMKYDSHTRTRAMVARPAHIISFSRDLSKSRTVL